MVILRCHLLGKQSFAGHRAKSSKNAVFSHFLRTLYKVSRKSPARELQGPVVLHPSEGRRGGGREVAGESNAAPSHTSHILRLQLPSANSWQSREQAQLGPEHTGHFVQPHVAAHCGGPEHTRATCGGDMYVMYANALSVAGTSHSLSHT